MLKRLIFSRTDQRLYLEDENGGLSFFECRSDFVAGLNDSGQPRASLPLGTYEVYALPWEDRGEGFGCGYIVTGDPRGRDIHGGGSGCEDPYAPRQGWCPTYGCLRMHNEDIRGLIDLIVEAGNSVRLDVVA